jgi:hypothetical protein
MSLSQNDQEDSFSLLEKLKSPQDRQTVILQKIKSSLIQKKSFAENEGMIEKIL